MKTLEPNDSVKELRHLRRLRDGVLGVLGDMRLSPQQKFDAIELLFCEERVAPSAVDEEGNEEEARDRERLS